MGEAVVREFSLNELPWVILRPFNAYGPNPTHPYIVPELIRQCIKEEVIKTGNVSSRRDFTYVTETAEAILKGMLAPGIEGETINICSGKASQMSDLLLKIQALTQATSKKRVIDSERLRPIGTDPDLLVGDASKAGKLLGWCPRIELETGLQRTIDDYLRSGGWPYEG
jgi:dTDP-glucose 4,6-dehydratase